MMPLVVMINHHGLNKQEIENTRVDSFPQGRYHDYMYIRVMSSST